MTDTGYAPVPSGVDMYWESRGTGGTPVILTPGGFGLATHLTDLAAHLARTRQVINVELRAHGHTGDTDAPFTYEAFGDDIAALATHLGLKNVDLLGLSLGGGATIRATIQHPDLVRRMVVISAPCRQEGWLPEVLAGMRKLNSQAFDWMRKTPLYTGYAEVAPDPAAYPTLMDKTGALLSTPYDWTDEVGKITTPTFLVYADADSVATQHSTEFFGLIGGGQADGHPDGTIKTPMRLAILPGRTHYNVTETEGLPELIAAFLDRT